MRPRKAQELACLPLLSAILTCWVMVFVGADVLEDERARRSDDEHLQHKVVQRFKKNLAEGLRFQRWAIVVAEVLCSLGEVFSGETNGHIHFKLVTDAFDFYIPKEKVVRFCFDQRLEASCWHRTALSLTIMWLATHDFLVVRSALVRFHQFNQFNSR